MPLTTVSPGLLDSNAQYYGFKNRIINGAMVIDQRNNGASVSLLNSLAYSTVDRFYTNASSSSGQYSAQRIALSDGSNRLRITSPAGGIALVVGQRIESANSYDLAGSAVTFRMLLSSSSTRTVTWTIFYANTTDNFTSTTQIATGTWNVGVAEQAFIETVTIPSAAITGLQLQISTANISGGATLTIGGVQLEKGSTATSFDYRPYGTELVLCQRYLPIINAAGASSAYVGVGQCAAGTTIINYFYKVTPRVAPTGIVVSSPSHFSIYNGIATSALSAIAFGQASSDTCTLSCTNVTSLSAGTSGGMYYSSASAQIQFTGCEL